MRKKQLRIEHQKKLKLIDSLSQELSLSNEKSQNLQSDLNNSSNDLILTSDSLKNSNLEINQLEVKLLASKNELSLLGLEIDNLVKESSYKTNLISDKNLQIDSLRTSLIGTKNDLAVSRDSIISISNSYNNSKGVSHWRQISNSKSEINEMDVTIQNKPLEVSMCSPGQILFFYDKAVIDGDRLRLKKRGDVIILTDSVGQSIRFLTKGDEMVLKYYDKKGDLQLTSTFNEVSENRYK